MRTLLITGGVSAAVVAGISRMFVLGCHVLADQYIPVYAKPQRDR